MRRYGAACLLNILLNLALVPGFGAVGAAIALAVSEAGSALLVFRRLAQRRSLPSARAIAEVGVVAMAAIGPLWALRTGALATRAACAMCLCAGFVITFALRDLRHIRRSERSAELFGALIDAKVGG